MKPITSTVPEPDFAAFLAIDWADELHAFCLCPSGSSQIESGTVRHDPQVLHPWLEELGRRFAGKPIAVAVELTRGPLVWALHEHAFLRIYPVTPITSAKLRQALYPAGAKSDPADSRLLLLILQQHRAHLRPLRWDETHTRLLGQLAYDRRQAVEQRTAAVERLSVVYLRRQCNRFLQHRVHLWADLSRHYCDWARIYYDAHRKKGKSHACAVRCLAMRWLKIVSAMMRSHTAYDAAVHSKNQLKHGPWVLELVPKVTEKPT